MATDPHQQQLHANLRLIFVDLAAPDAHTTQADARAAVCLAAGVHPDYISSLGYDHSDRSYASVRSSWVRHIEQWGLRVPLWGDVADSDVMWAYGLWLEGRPDLAEGDDWLAAGWEAHERMYPAGCGNQSCDLCVYVLKEVSDAEAVC
jgi:hypothetical protein